MRRTNQSKRFEQQAAAALARGDLDAADTAYWFAALGTHGIDRETLHERQARVNEARRRRSAAANDSVEGSHVS
jgi:hypothetical protein